MRSEPHFFYFNYSASISIFSNICEFSDVGIRDQGCQSSSAQFSNFSIFPPGSDIQGIDKVSLYLLQQGFADSVLSGFDQRILLFYGCCFKMIISKDKILLKRGLCLFLCLFFVCSFFLSVSKESAKKNFNWEANNSLLLIVSAN